MHPCRIPSHLIPLFAAAWLSFGCTDASLDEVYGGGPYNLGLHLCDGVSRQADGSYDCVGPRELVVASDHFGAPTLEGPYAPAAGDLVALARFHDVGKRHQGLFLIERLDYHPSGPDCREGCAPPEWELVQAYLPGLQGPASGTSSFYRWIRVARDGTWRYRAHAVAPGSCEQSGEFALEDCDLLDTALAAHIVRGFFRVEDTEGALVPVEEIADAGFYVPEVPELTIIEQRKDHNAPPATKSYDFGFARLCRVAPASAAPCLARGSYEFAVGESVYVHYRANRVTARRPEMRIGVYRQSDLGSEMFYVLPGPRGLGLQAEGLLPSTEDYGNGISGWSYIWGGFRLWLNQPGSYTLIPKLRDRRRGGSTEVTHFDTDMRINIVVN